jgi:N-acetylmuramoyl-L-alanine amidase
MGYLNKQMALILMAFLIAIGSASAAETSISRITLVQDESATKAFVDLSGQTGFKSFTLQGPNRAVLDIDNASLGQGVNLPAGNGVVLSVRQGKTPTGIRLVFDLAGNSLVNSAIDTSNGKVRLVVELKASNNIISSTAITQTLHSEPMPAKPVPMPAIASTPEKTTSLTTSAAVTPSTVLPKSVVQNVKPPMPLSPERPAMGYALMDDEIVQIEIDSSGAAPKTTVKPTTGKKSGSDSAKSAPKPAAVQKPSSSAQIPVKKGKTVNDVLGPTARKIVIAIDAGHGGKDPGAIGPSGLQEKDVTLRVARELANAINADPGMRAVLIRDNDQFVALQDRYMRARRAQADMFISIHADAALNHEASGSSVYVLSTKGASSQAARWLADKENAADLVGGVSLDNKDKFLSAVLLDLSQSATMRMSEDAAGNVLQSLKDLGKAHKKQVEYANFVVLRSPDVPSMLVETGFITNAEEERKLSNPEHRKRLAFAISQGVRSFFIEQPLPGTYFARSSTIAPTGVNAVSGGVFP